MKVKEYIKPGYTGYAIDPNDRNNCVVRALANSGIMHITEATSLLAKYGRKQGHGTYQNVSHKAYTAAGLKNLGVFGTTKFANYDVGVIDPDQPRHKGCTFATLLKNLDVTKTYVVFITGHAVCVRKGVVMDTGSLDGAKSVVKLWEVPNA